MKIPEPGSYVRVFYFKERPGKVTGEIGEIVTVSADQIVLKYQGKYEGAIPSKSIVLKKDIAKIMVIDRWITLHGA